MPLWGAFDLFAERVGLAQPLRRFADAPISQSQNQMPPRFAGHSLFVHPFTQASLATVLETNNAPLGGI
jgi:hypothetical protein